MTERSGVRPVPEAWPPAERGHWQVALRRPGNLAWRAIHNGPEPEARAMYWSFVGSMPLRRWHVRLIDCTGAVVESRRGVRSVPLTSLRPRVIA